MDYKTILKMVYDQFGEEFIARGKAAFEQKMLGNNVSDSCAEEDADDEGFDYYNGDKFESQIVSRLKGSATNAITNPSGVVAAIGDLTYCVIEACKFGAVQETKRTEIAMQRDIALANIETQKAVLLDYLEKSFDERKENFREFFKVVDNALEKDNMQQLALGLENIIILAQSSPFKDLRTLEETTSALSDPNHEWDF